MRRLALGALISAAAATALAATGLRGHTQVPDFAALRGRIAVAFGFFDSRRGVISRIDGRLVVSADGGRTWQVHGRPWLSRIDVVSASTAYATRGRWLLRTDNEGATWRPVTRAAGALSFADRLHGWIVAGRRTLATDDGGRTVHRLRVPCTGADSTQAVTRVTSTLGFVACAGEPGGGGQEKRLHVTHDAGQTWRLVAGIRAAPIQGYLSSILFTSERDGFLTADRGGVAVTRDGGRTWRWILSTDLGAFVEAAQGTGPHTLLALLGNGALFRSDDAGRHRQLLYPRTQPGPDQVSFATVTDGIGVGYDWPMMRRQVVATHDGGRTWQLRSLLAADESPTALDRVSAKVVYLVADTYRRVGDDLFRSADDGRTWTRVATPGSARLFAVSFTSVRDGVLGDDAGRFYVTRDAARTWALVHGRGQDRRRFVFLTPAHGLALPTVPDGALYETRDGARSWHPFKRVQLQDPTGVAVLGPEHIWITDQACPPPPNQPNCPGAIVRTSDSGRTWQRIALNMLPTDSLDFVTPSVGYAASPYSPYRTTDGGRTWTLLGSG